MDCLKVTILFYAVYNSLIISILLFSVRLEGDFLRPELTSLALDKLFVELILEDNKTVLDKWQVGILPEELFDREFIRETALDYDFNLQGLDLSIQNVSLRIYTNSDTPVAFAANVQVLSRKVDNGVIYGAMILVALYISITFEFAHRTVIAMLGATCAIAVLATLNERPSLEEIITWVDIETLTLLFSMMVMVSILSETGAFNFLGFWAFKFTKGKVWPLLFVLGGITAFVSAILDNVTTILLMTPVVIQLCETINIDTGLKKIITILQYRVLYVRAK